ncbi:MAG: hypothetical protein QW434_10490 [Pyrobaculum sp.]
MHTEYSWHAIAVGNRLMGPYNFVVLVAPPSWRIVIMPMASEVFRHREVDGVKWVRDGEVMHFIRDGGEIYTLRIKVKPGRKEARGNPIVINGHGGVYWVEERGGRLNLTLHFYCEHTDRTVQIRVEGLRDTSALQFLQNSKCH